MAIKQRGEQHMKQKLPSIITILGLTITFASCISYFQLSEIPDFLLVLMGMFVMQLMRDAIEDTVHRQSERVLRGQVLEEVSAEIRG